MAKQSIKTARKLAARIRDFNQIAGGNSKLKYHKPGSQNRKK